MNIVFKRPPAKTTFKRIRNLTEYYSGINSRRKGTLDAIFCLDNKFPCNFTFFRASTTCHTFKLTARLASLCDEIYHLKFENYSHEAYQFLLFQELQSENIRLLVLAGTRTGSPSMRCVLHIFLSLFHVRAYIMAPSSKYKSLFGNVTTTGSYAINIKYFRTKKIFSLFLRCFRS